MFLRFISLVGLASIIGIAYIFSDNPRAISWRLVCWGVIIQIIIALILLPTALQTHFLSPVLNFFIRLLTFGKIQSLTSIDKLFFNIMRVLVNLLNNATTEGARFVFGNLVTDPAYGATVAFQVLPVIIVVSTISAIGYHFGIIPAIIRSISRMMQYTLKTSGAETFGTGLLIILGIESMTAIRAYLSSMTRSELLTIMTAFMATIAGSVMVVYSNFGAEPGHLLTASLMSAPAAIVISKILLPEQNEPTTMASKRIEISRNTYNMIDAASRGASEGLHLAFHVAGMLIAFLAIIYLLNVALEWITRPILNLIYIPWAQRFNLPLLDSINLKAIFSLLFAPCAWLMGVPMQDVFSVAQLLGTKTVLNEFLAYIDLQELRSSLQPRSYLIALYALCGFANPGSLGILLAGMTALAPERREDITRLGFKAFLGGTLACFMTACIVGVILYE